MLNSDGIKIGSKTRGYFFAAARTRGYCGQELHWAIREMNRTIGELERGDPGLAERIESALADGQGHADRELYLLRLAVSSVLGSDRDCRPLTETQERVLRIHAGDLQGRRDPSDEIDQADYETITMVAVNAAIDQLSEGEQEILWARFSPYRTLEEAARVVGISTTIYRRTLKNIIDRLADELSQYNV